MRCDLLVFLVTSALATNIVSASPILLKPAFGRPRTEEFILDVGGLADRYNQEPWEVSGKFEGDIVFPAGITAANGLVATRPRWFNRTVPYILDPIFNATQRASILRGIEEFHRRTCIRLRPSTPYDRDYVYVSGYSTGCWSYVGRLNGGQMLNLQIPGCFRHGTIVHEFLHALGFYHQQSTHNRDDYVAILWQNIRAGTERNFNKYDARVVTDFGTDYDYSSVMHYSRTAFSVNGQATIVPLQNNVTIGQRVEMSEADVVKLEKMYGCRN
ncbi:zinc metalloproteinase nas-13-like isoform X2 [Bacillus rossius redtenbacheri]|uniref:zinc metalloproteinase nas-13-like isoform X2 n=1 Tax=Bacillus rossius redtenbacheri TaxID=93214 RepID=UPI002FDCDD81